MIFDQSPDPRQISLNTKWPPRSDHLLDRALAILHRFATEQTGWRRHFRRWYYVDEPLRNDAANLVREAGFDMPRPQGTQIVGDDRVDRERQAHHQRLVAGMAEKIQRPSAAPAVVLTLAVLALGFAVILAVFSLAGKAH